MVKKNGHGRRRIREKQGGRQPALFATTQPQTEVLLNHVTMVVFFDCFFLAPDPLLFFLPGGGGSESRKGKKALRGWLSPGPLPCFFGQFLFSPVHSATGRDLINVDRQAGGQRDLGGFSFPQGMSPVCPPPFLIVFVVYFLLIHLAPLFPLVPFPPPPPLLPGDLKAVPPPRLPTFTVWRVSEGGEVLR